MGIDQTRRITFEEAADFYNETRPEYPDEVVEDGMRLSATTYGAAPITAGRPKAPTCS